MLLLTNSLSFLHGKRSPSFPRTTRPPPPPFLFLNPDSRHFRLPQKFFFFLHSHLFPLKLCHFYLLFRIIFVFKAVGGVRFDGPEIEVGEVSETEDGDLVIETGVTWTLTPALTFPQGLEKIREAVEELKLNPPSTCTGIHSYPLFFMGKDVENPSYKSLYVNETRGVFGIGAAVHFAPSSSSSSFKRLVLVFLFALVDFDGTPTQVAHVVASLVEEGFTAVKLRALFSSL
ncbi:unnamed protein product [Malus baccata var. baccata]